MEELGLTIGELAEKTDIDTVRLVATLFGQEEMRAFEWIGLSEALDVSLDWMVEASASSRAPARRAGTLDESLDDLLAGVKWILFQAESNPGEGSYVVRRSCSDG